MIIGYYIPPKSSGEAGCRKVPLRGLSRVRGNPHARFLGGNGVVMRCSYPTLSSNAPLYAEEHPIAGGTQIIEHY